MLETYAGCYRDAGSHRQRGLRLIQNGTPCNSRPVSQAVALHCVPINSTGVG